MGPTAIMLMAAVGAGEVAAVELMPPAAVDAATRPDVLASRIRHTTKGIEPPRGTPQIIAGSIMTGLGIWGLGSMAVYRTKWYGNLVGSKRRQDIAFYTAMVYGGSLFLSGGITLIYGVVKRRQYNAWEAGKAGPTASIDFRTGGPIFGWCAPFQ